MVPHLHVHESIQIASVLVACLYASSEEPGLEGWRSSCNAARQMPKRTMVSIRPRGHFFRPPHSHVRMSATPSRNRARRVRCSAPEPIGSLSAGGNNQLQLVYRFHGLIPRSPAFYVCCAGSAGSSFRPSASVALTLCCSELHELCAKVL
jgi:hypothetical protein